MVPVGTGVAWGSPSDVLCPVTFTADANFTLPLPAANALILTCGTITNLTATRNLVVPNVTGQVYFVFNNTGGAQSIQVIGASGTGVTIATGKRAVVYFDGTNWVRLTADT